MKKHFRFVMAQLDFLIGDIEANTDKVIKNALLAKETYHADLILFPELTLTGYPPEDLLFRSSLYERIDRALEKIKQEVTGIDILIGYPLWQKKHRYNVVSLISNGKIVATYRKVKLPNYSVFDEARYFVAGDEPLVLNYHDLPMGITICEDLWGWGPLHNTVVAGAKIILSINASPFDMRKHENRLRMLQSRAKEGQVPILYVNCVGGQDELVFDGGSIVIGPEGDIYQRGQFYQEELMPVDIAYDTETQQLELSKTEVLPLLNHEERIYKALVLGLRDYIQKNKFTGAIIGLSGGIDSALTLTLACDAIGADRVEAVLMPSQYTQQMSIDDALAQASLLNVKASIIPIEPIFATFLESLDPFFRDLPTDKTEENLQARCRGTLLMALSNKHGSIVLTTGNKSEMAVGYATLYGDMAGGFSVLKDIPKTLVYKLVAYRNSIHPVIPERVITRPPSAELAHDQKDEDTLPPYPVLDQILELYIEKDKSIKDIIKLGFDAETVRKIVKMIQQNEYKRSQAPIGVRITQRAFGRDRRYPITSGFRDYEQE